MYTVHYTLNTVQSTIVHDTNLNVICNTTLHKTITIKLKARITSIHYHKLTT